MTSAPGPRDVDEYLVGISPAARAALVRFRGIIHEFAPDVTESIAYGMPTFTVVGRHRFHVAGWSKHLGVYPVREAPEPLQTALATLRTGKDTVQLPLNAPLDETLVRQLVAFLLERPSG